MSHSKATHGRGATTMVLAMVLAVGASAAPALAQSGVELGTGENLLHILNDNGVIAVDFDVNTVGIPEEVVFGRADTAGSDEADVDLEIVDAFSTLSNTDRSLFFNASQSDLRLGSGSATQPGNGGDLLIENGMGVTVIDIAGADGDINQDIDNDDTDGFGGNGAVKAWAIIRSNGDVARCWKCNTSSSATQQLETGLYEVDFLLGDIDKRPVLATPACFGSITIFSSGTIVQCTRSDRMLGVAPRRGDTSSFHVNVSNDQGTQVNGGFTIIVF